MDYYNEDYLMHYGIKGMKWGVRRYQNADGTLTAKGEKRLAKNEAYRDKLVKKAQKKADKNKSKAAEAEYNVKDLKKRGTKSQAYRDWKESEDTWREYEYESKNKLTTDQGKTYYKRYSTSGTRLVNDVFDHVNANNKVQDLIDENNATARRSRDAAKKWTNSKKDLMNMEVSALTKKKDIKKVYRN